MREKLTSLARALRQRETSSEEKLWLALRNRQIDGWKFRRQVPRGPYVVDFLCAEAQLVVEIDGIQHYEPDANVRDERRSEYLRGLGLRMLRFSNSDVIDNPEAVLDEIYVALGRKPAPKPGSLRRRIAAAGIMRPQISAAARDKDTAP